jgi:hypothetical protein
MRDSELLCTDKYGFSHLLRRGRRHGRDLFMPETVISKFGILDWFTHEQVE